VMHESESLVELAGGSRAGRGCPAQARPGVKQVA